MEFQNFVTDDFARLITESRKFGIATTIAHQERYGQLLENRKIIGATQAAGNKVIFQLTPEDAAELAPEFADKPDATETRREAELVFSTHAVEDIWERGHPSDIVMDVRDTYFWIVDLLKQNPRDYCIFDPSRITAKRNNRNPHHINWREYDDLVQYRSSVDQLRRGIYLLNKYYYACQQGKYREDKQAGAEELELVFEIIENLAGVMGWRPLMVPYITDETGNLYVHKFQELTTKLESEYIQREKQGLRNESAFPKIRNIKNPAGHIPVSFIPEWKQMALMTGLTQYEINESVQWDLRPISSLEKEALIELIRLVINMFADKASYDANWERAVVNYITIMLAVENPVDAIKRELAYKRLGWQTIEIQHFVLWCIRACGRYLRTQAIKVVSGQYDETLRIEKTQREMIDEMVDELSNLPRFTAYTKVLQQSGAMGEIQLTVKEKITTLKVPDPMTHPLQQIITMQNARTEGESYCRDRTGIEKEIIERQSAWKKETKTKTKKPPPSNAPPPTSY